LDILEAGLPYAIQPSDVPATTKERLDYINDYLLRLQQAHKPDKLQAVCQQYLAQDLPSPQARDLFALNLVSFDIDAGRFDDADDIIKKYALEQTFQGVMLESRVLWESGRLYAAPAYLEKALPRFPGNDDIYGLLSRYYRDLGNLDQSLTYILLREGVRPDNAEPRIERLYITAKGGDPIALHAETDDLIAQFHAKADAMTQLASFATDQGDVKLATSLFDLAQTQYQIDMKNMGKSNFNLASFSLLVCEAYLTNNQYRYALAYLDSLNAAKPDWLEPYRLYFDSMRAVADYGIGDYSDCDVYLTHLVKSTTTRPDTLMTIANRFLSHGALDQAQRLFYAAHHMDPHNQAILAQLISVNLQLGNSAEMDQNLKDLLNTRRPPLELLYDAYRQLGTDRFTFVPDRESLLNLIDQHIRDAIKIRNEDGES
jgi:predicted Zn-dependent protease